MKINDRKLVFEALKFRRKQLLAEKQYSLSRADCIVCSVYYDFQNGCDDNCPIGIFSNNNICNDYSKIFEFRYPDITDDMLLSYLDYWIKKLNKGDLNV